MKKIGLSLLVAVFLVTSPAYASDRGNVAVASDGKTVTAQVSEVAARSPFFLIFDADGKLTEVVDNPYKGAKRGAGTSIVTLLAQKGVTFVVAGEFGDNMIQAMKSKGIGYLDFKGSVDAAFKKALERKKQK